MQKYIFTIGTRPKISGKDLKAVHQQGEKELTKNNPFNEVFQYPPYSTVARNLRQNGHYSSIVFLDGAYSQTISFHLITCIDDEK